MVNSFIEILHKRKNWSKFIVQFLKTNLGYDRIDSIISCTVEALVEYLKNTGEKMSEDFVDKILNFGKIKIKDQIRSFAKNLCTMKSSDILLVCPNGHTNIGNRKMCKYPGCKCKLIIGCSTTESCQNSPFPFCPHTECIYNNCYQLDITALHSTFLLSLSAGNGEYFTTLTRLQYAQALQHDMDNMTISNLTSGNMYALLSYLDEHELLRLFDLERKSPMAHDLQLNDIEKPSQYSSSNYFIFILSLIDDLRNKCDEIMPKYKEQKKKGFPSKAESGKVFSNNHPNSPNTELATNSKTTPDIQAQVSVTSQASTKNGKQHSMYYYYVY